MHSYKIDDIMVQSLSRSELESLIIDVLNTSQTNHFVTLNLDFLRNASINQEFKSILQRAELVTSDGIGISILGYFLYRKKILRITGNDIFEFILRISAHRIIRIALLGAEKHIHEMIREKLAKQNLRVQIVSSISPPKYFEKDNLMNTAIVKEMFDSKPDVVFVALGSPKQELWIDKNRLNVGARLYVGVGAVLDLFAGSKKRSPVFLQRIGFEWIWRLIHEPKRLWKRYLVHDLSFLIKSIYKIILNK